MLEGKPLTYLACAYFHPDRMVRCARFEAANKAAACLMRRGHIVFSPISHNHPILEAATLPLGWEFWCDFDTAYISCSREVVVLRLPGWEESKGVQAEIAVAKTLGIPVSFIDPEE